MRKMQIHTNIQKFIYLDTRPGLSTTQLKKRDMFSNEIKEQLSVIGVQVEESNDA